MTSSLPINDVSDLIGREAESEVLDAVIDQIHVRGGALIVRGEAGIGKSRLMQKLHERLSSLPRPPTRIRMQCSPFHTTTLLHPVFRQLEYAAGFLPKDTSDTKLDKLEALLRQGVEEVAEGMVPLVDDGQEHQVEVVMGPAAVTQPPKWEGPRP